MAELVLSGCAPTTYKIEPLCPGAKSGHESLSRLRSSSQNALPFKAAGQCRLQYYAEGKKHTENFPVKLWANPPYEIYLQGDVAFNPKGIVLGTNKNEFWLAMKPKEVDAYWWGRWEQQKSRTILGIDPELLLRAFGIAPIAGKGGWLLSREGGFDVLSKVTDSGSTEKIYLDRCSYNISKIVKTDAYGNDIVVAKLHIYKELSENFSVPKLIEIISRIDGDNEDSLRITLNSVKTVKFSGQQKTRLFNRPPPRGFEHVYMIVDGDIIEQK